MSKSQYINICFSDRDKELITWANMIRDDGQSVNTWIQAVLLAEAVGEPLDAGAVYIPKSRPKAASAGSLMFGDDRKSAQSGEEKRSGWQIRGENGEIIAGSIISIRVTRPVIVSLIDSLLQSHRRLGPYAKAVLRKKIRKLDSGTNVPPDESQVQDIFALYEDRYVTNARPKMQAEPSAQCRDEQQGQSSQDRSSLPAEKDQRRDKRSRHQNRSHRNPPPQQQAPQQGPQKQLSPQKQEERPQKTKNPLLGYIS